MNEEREPGPYDRQARAEIERWKAPDTSLASRAMRVASKPLEAGAQLVLDNTPLGAAVRGVVTLLNEGATYTVSEEPVYGRFEERGHVVRTAKEIGQLPLEEVDAVAAYLSTK